MLVPFLDFSSAASFVRSCKRCIAASPASWGPIRSALTLSSLSDANSGFQWPFPCFCLERESALCLSNSRGFGSSVFVIRIWSLARSVYYLSTGCRVRCLRLALSFNPRLLPGTNVLLIPTCGLERTRRLVVIFGSKIRGAIFIILGELGPLAVLRERLVFW